MKFGTIAGKEVCKALGIEFKEGSLGVEVDFIKPQFSRSQQCGHWFLLSTWIEMSDLTVTSEKLHQWCLGKHFGYIERELPDNRIDWMPTRTTTKIYDHDAGRYKYKKMTRTLYAEYIETIYRLAAEGGIELPTLEKQWKT